MRIVLLFISLIFFYSRNFSQQLVMPGDHPDPSVVKINNTYWASATTSNWFPAYPLMSSSDLLHWNKRGFVFNTIPEWADYYFWAPEISYDSGKVYIYYAAHKKAGNLCLGVASADKPEGPYKDHGPLMCQDAGSIDAFPMRDENGKLYLIWKEDGNSVKKPTPIWAQQLNEERTALTGEKTELFRNNKGWEVGLVEGVSMLKHGDYYYAFYAADACCGKECSYKTGIARSKTLLGPWEKYNKNPVLVDNEHWKCPGHGTPVEKDGKFYFLYHAYDKTSGVFTGREGLLNEFRFTADGWIEFLNTPDTKSAYTNDFYDKFNRSKLSPNWQWSVFENVRYEQNDGELNLNALPVKSGAFLGISIKSANFTASVQVNRKGSDAKAGIALIGDDKNSITAYYKDATVTVVKLVDGKEIELARKVVSESKKYYLQMQVTNGKDIIFSYSTDRKVFIPINEKAADGNYLPPWDRAVRAGIVAKGTPEQKVIFDNFYLENK